MFRITLRGLLACSKMVIVISLQALGEVWEAFSHVLCSVGLEGGEMHLSQTGSEGPHSLPTWCIPPAVLGVGFSAHCVPSST